MESGAVGRLGLKTKTNFHWKGKTFSQVSSILQKNKPDTDTNKNKGLFFKALPNKIYRREILSSVDLSQKSGGDAKIYLSIDTPGGTIVNTQSTFCQGITGTVDLPLVESKTALQCSSGCNSYLDNDISQRNSKYIQSLSLQDNARRRVRSSGMTRPRFKNNHNGQSDNYASAGQYLHSRNKTFQQNQFSNLRMGDSTATPGSTASQENKYASNTIQYCGSSGLTNYVPVYYKPSNSKFAQQGAVDAGCRLTRLKYDTITKSGNSMREAYGPSTANALAYGVPSNGYTIKDKIGYPNKCTPKFPKYGCSTDT